MPFSGTISAPESKRFLFRPSQARFGNCKFRSCRKALTRFTTSPSLLMGDLWLLRPRRDHSRVEGFGYDGGTKRSPDAAPEAQKQVTQARGSLPGAARTG